MFGWLKKKSPAPFLPSKSAIVPRIKTETFATTLKAMNAPPDQLPFMEPLFANLLVTYAFDAPGVFVMATEAEITRLGISLEDVRTLAMANLRRQYPKIGIHDHGTIRQIVLGDDLEACMLLADSFWDQAAGEVSGDVVVSVPSRNVVVYCGSESEVGLHALRAVADQVMKSETTHALTEELFVRRNGRWTKFEEQNP